MAKIYTFGKFDKNDFKHFFLGIVVYFIIFGLTWLIDNKTTFDLALNPKYISLIGLFCVAYIWEFGQNKFYGAMIDWKDVLVTTIPGFIAIIFL